MSRHSFHPALLIIAVAFQLLSLPATGEGQSFVAFESGHVRPLALSPDGTRLFAVNTPDNRLELFDVQAGNLVHAGSVPVGLEPVAVAARSNDEVWVVNHLSDSISIVDVLAAPPRVTQTLLVGDEPRDIVFADGAGGERAYVTTARRGQNSPVPPLLSTPGVGRALVWVFDPAATGDTLTGTPLSIIELFGDTPRALAVSPDGNTVYAAVFHSGNQTTTITESAVCDGGAGAPSCNLFGFTMPGGLPAPNTNFDGTPQPETGLIVRFDPSAGEWRDELDRNWNDYVRFSLPDEDVFAISNTTLLVEDSFASVGTINFNMVANPVSGKLYVTNTEAINEVRFEGPGTHVTTGALKPPGEPASVIGHLHEARITVIDALGDVTPRHLNKHIDYSIVPSPAGTKDHSLATPLEMAVSDDGSTLYVAAFGSQKIGVFDTSDLEDDSFDPSSTDHITLTGGGPTGLVLDQANDQLFVATRFDNSISVVDTLTNVEVAHVSMFNPEPTHIVDGRPILYDAARTSSNGEASCAACHVFGGTDSLGWDLGNPDEAVTTNPLTLADPVVETSFEDFHPLKGPMTTQTLRGMGTHGAMHWRGDRSIGHFGTDPVDEALSSDNFIVAFEGLLGNDGLIPDADMFAFTAFILDVALPPNPIRPLDNQLSATAEAGRFAFHVSGTTAGGLSCRLCHVIAPANGLYGSNRLRGSVDGIQQFKIPHLRNLYTKVGMFGMPETSFLGAGDNGHQGAQIRGFGILHDGSIDRISRFLGSTTFTVPPADRTTIEQFLFEFATNYAPIVGQQATLTPANAPAVDPRIDLMTDRARACFDLPGLPDSTECDLVVRGIADGEARAWLGQVQGSCDTSQPLLFQGDRASDPVLTASQLRAFATTGDPMTWTCVPPGSGSRIALDRDEDGHFDRDELDAGSDPADPSSTPSVSAPPPTLAGARKLRIRDNSADFEHRRAITIVSTDATVVPPTPESPGDPTCNGSPDGTIRASLTISSSFSGQTHRSHLPCQHWTRLGTPTKPRGYRYRDRDLVDGTVKTALWREGRLKLVLRGSGAFFLDYDLVDGTSEDTVDVVLISDAGNLCLACPAAGDKDGSDGRTFVGKTCPAPASCGSP